MRIENIKSILEKSKIPMDDFHDFMYGQTVGVYDDGELNYYETDVNRFFRSHGIKEV